jgi:hypothetical protein
MDPQTLASSGLLDRTTCATRMALSVRQRRLMTTLHRSFLQSLASILLLLQIGCGAAKLGMCAPHTKEEGTPSRNWVECFEQPLSHQGITHSVFCLNDGTSKPPVLLLHEMTGLTPGALAYSEELSKDFTVYVPCCLARKASSLLPADSGPTGFADWSHFPQAVNGTSPLREAPPLSTGCEAWCRRSEIGTALSPSASSVIA